MSQCILDLSVATGSGPSVLVAGVDEAGRGPLAGPVAAAAVVFDPSRPRINGLDDSKQLTAARRETLYARIVERALAWHVVMVEVEEIDRLNIYHATMLGMRLAVEAVAHVAGLARIDGNALPKGLPCRGETLIGGDRLDRTIMAASILAKVSRDRLMVAMHDEFPAYGFAVHKGYSTPSHLTALTEHGPRNTGAASRRCGVRWVPPIKVRLACLIRSRRLARIDR